MIPFKSTFAMIEKKDLGQTLIELSLILLVIGCVVFLGITFIGKSAKNSFEKTSDSLRNAPENIRTEWIRNFPGIGGKPFYEKYSTAVKHRKSAKVRQ